uniref:acetate--CoA ligase n=1 Tax=Romanomermis culicivorax TaxID=13658 RepID=A0A915I1S8_ROMCU
MYMPMSIKLAACMLACARIGAVHNVVFAGFSAEALASRINDAQSETVITADQAIRGGKIIELKQIVDKAKKTCPSVKRVFVMQRTGAPIKLRDNEFCLEKLIFNYNEGDIFGCMADIGWVTGHSYIVYGPLANGATSVIFESTPTYPDAGRYWDVVQRLKITHFYGSPTAYRLLHSFPNDFIKKYDLSSLKVVGSVGEPINQDAWHWLNDNIGKRNCMVLDTWWQTETGGSCIAPSPADTGAVIKPTMAMRPFYGILPLVLDQEGELVPDSLTVGNLFLGQPWPGMARTIYGDHKRYITTYFRQQPGKYFTGDGAHIDIEGHIQIIGRIDDVLNISGHRLGTAEIEDVLDDHPLVAETACIGVPHKIKGESVYAYISLKQGAKYDESTLIQELKALIKKAIASYAVPEEILIVDGLPKTRSGKIMRRILKKIAVGEKENLGDVSTLSDPNSVDRILRKYVQIKNEGGTTEQQPKISKKM